MSGDQKNMLTAGKIAAELKLSPVQVKKAITDLKIKPTAVKGGCSYYSTDLLPKIKSAAK
jgi:hypothetical protein